MNLTIDELVGKSVKVYWNLHKNVFSVQYKGRVVAHLDNIVLDNPRFYVSESGNKRVLKEKRKNVHAFIYGIIHRYTLTQDTDEPAGYSRVKYNPYKCAFFYYECNGKRVGPKDFAILWNGAIYV